MIHELICGRGFAGFIASLCGADLLEIVGPGPEDISNKKVSSNKTPTRSSKMMTTVVAI